LRAENIKKYLSYALGEILLVVVGILLAMQVDNWNQNRLENIKEVKALNDLYEEFELNRKRIEEKQNKRINIIPHFDTYVTAIASGNANYDSFSKFHTQEFASGMTNPSHGVIDALISSGELTLISNDSLKYLIADWKDQASNLKENELILWNTVLEYVDFYHKYVSVPTAVWGEDSALQYKGFKILQSQIEYKNKLLNLRSINGIVIDECNTVLQSMSKIMTLLQREITNQEK
jgi:hypothetical protein